MKHFYRHEASGRIASTGTCQDEDFELQAQAGLTLREGVAVYGLDYFDGTTVLPLPVKPSAQHVFDYASRQWNDPRTLQDRKDAQWAVIKQARQTALDTPLITPFGVFDADPVSVNNIIKSVLLANNLAALGYPVAIDFTLYDNSVHVMDALAMVQVELLLAAREQLIRAQATVLRAQIEAALDEAAVAAVTWPD